MVDGEPMEPPPCPRCKAVVVERGDGIDKDAYTGNDFKRWRRIEYFLVKLSGRKRAKPAPLETIQKPQPQ
jgi:hypothetical protein